MHELAIAQSLLDVIEREVQKHEGGRVAKVKLRIGEFAGVVKEALEFSFDIIKQGTIAAAAELDIEVIGLRKRCATCDETFDSAGDFDLSCPQCHAPVDIVSGREMQIEYIELE